EPDLFPEPLAQKLGHAPAQAVPDHLQHVSGTLVEARPLEVRTTRTVYEPYGHVEQVAHLLHGPGDDRAHAEGARNAVGRDRPAPVRRGAGPRGHTERVHP